MQAHVDLQFASAFLTFFLQATAASLVCMGFTRLLRHPQHRFLVWLVFLAASGLYWLGLAGDLGLRIFRPASALAASAASVPGAVSAHGRFLLPAAWIVWLGRLFAVVGFSYLGGALWLAGRQMRRSIALHRLLKLGSQPSPELAQLIQGMCREAGIRECEMLVLPELVSPATVCWWKPRILLPEACNQQEITPQLEDVFRHELVHIARRDYLISRISDGICALLFFHPAVWHARKQMRVERELACDLAVVDERPDHRADYADSLAHFVRQHMLQQQSASQGMDFAGSVSFLALRIRHILAEPGHAPWWKKLSTATAGVAMWTAFAVFSPALAIVLDFAAKPEPVVPVAGHQTAAPVTQHRSRAKKHLAKSEGATAATVSLPDTLTSLRVHDRVDNTDEFQTSRTDSGGGISVGPEVNSPAWREGSPASPRRSGPSVRSIVLATIGGVATSERKERNGHGRGR